MKVIIEGNIDEYLGYAKRELAEDIYQALLMRLKADVEIELNKKFAEWKHKDMLKQIKSKDFH